MTKIPPKLTDRRRSPFYEIPPVTGLTDITKEMRENYWGNALLESASFKVARVFSIPGSETREKHNELIMQARAACKGKIAAIWTDTSLKIALEIEEDAVFLKMFLG